MKIKGIISSNLGEASQNIKIQLPYFRDLPNRQRLHCGTINLDIYPKKFILLKSYKVYSNVDWGKTIEDFHFIKLLKLGKPGKLEKTEGYLYLPSNSPNYQKGSVLEIWTEWIAGISIKEEWEIEIPDGYLKVG